MFLWVLLSSGMSRNNMLQCLNFLSFDLALPPFNCTKWSAVLHVCCHRLWCTAGLVHIAMLTVLLKEAVMSVFYWSDGALNYLFKFAWRNLWVPAWWWTSLVLPKHDLQLAYALFWTQQASYYFCILSSLSIYNIFPRWAFPCSCHSGCIYVTGQEHISDVSQASFRLCP